MLIFNLIGQQYLSMNVSFNSNFLEANVLNIVLLLSGLIYVLKQFLGSILSLRQEKVLFAINESEERLKQATERLDEAEKQLAQTQIIVDQIIAEAQTTAKNVSQSILDQGKIDIERLTLSSKDSIKYAESQVRQQIQQQIIDLAIKKVSIKLSNEMTSSLQNRIIDTNIMQLKDNINI
uniref:ATP synthase subunit b, chloroplastic n=1 Tax=Dasya naccarioides TaxID=2007180 RepID=A0A1Z1MHD3_9FLOR|nr:ATP synthase CF0 subunit I [Dasya naccarioides]ARW65171.1 ATP synthase CF0 subunit I [Dasya naccarioides]